MAKRPRKRGVLKGNTLYFDQREWKLISNVSRAWTIRDLARHAKMPYSTANKVLARVKEKAIFKFRIKMQEVGLVPLIVLLKKDLKFTPPPYTLSVKRLKGVKSLVAVTALLPPTYVNDYVNALNEEPVSIVVGYELHHWYPDPVFNIYDEKTGTLQPRFAFEETSKLYSGPVDRWMGPLRSPDKIDLAIISMKMSDPFMRPSEVFDLARNLDPELPKLSTQALSYHTVHHVKERYWENNAANIRIDETQVPVRFFYLEGDKAPMVARMFVKLPGFHYAVIDINKAVVIGQPLAFYFEHLYNALSEYGVEMPLGELIISRQEVQRYVPTLWKFIERKRWIFNRDVIPMKADGTIFEKIDLP